MDINEKINLAFKNFQQGTIEQAEKDCLEILESQPENSEILHLLGVTYYHLGAHEQAVQYLKKSIEIEDQNADVLYDLGNVLQDQGNLDEALKAYQCALEIEPEHPDAHNNIGMVFHDLGHLDEAIVHYQKALELTPQSAMIHNNIALAYQENDELQKAIAHYGKAIQLDSNYADAHLNIGNVFMKEEELDTAYAYYFKSVQLNPNCVEAYLGMGHILIRKSKFAEAIPLLGKVLMFYPDSAEIHNNLGNALGEIWQLDEAIPHLERAIQLNPDFAEAYSNLGNTLSKMGKYDEGMKHISRALQLEPKLIEAVINLGNIYKVKGEFREAVTCYRKALLLDPGNADARFNIALMDLLQGQFEAGWEGYEFRWKMKNAWKRNLPQPLWDGSPIQGKRLFMYAEQGIGDEIMFASCLPEMVKQAEMPIVECDKKLLPLFERSFTGSRIIGRLESDGYPPELPPADYRIAIGSLPRYLRPDLTSFPKQKSYLVSDEEKVGEWKSRYRELGAGLKVGVSWRGGSTPDVIRVRSTNLTQWADLFAISGVHFINLQYGDCREELKKAEEDLGVRICDWEDADPLKDLDGFAAQIAALDLVLSTDNATVHMAGALGVPVWVLLPRICDWRWMQDFEDTPWYETVRLFRQDKPGEWEGVFERVKQHLDEAMKQEPLSRSTLLFQTRLSYKTEG
jgi:tetratricopeptide (TPR) repeat protein